MCRGRTYGPTYGTGDTVGAALDFVTRTISFYLNGVSQGIAFIAVSENVSERKFIVFSCLLLIYKYDLYCLERKFE